jgi:hypothetical protein
MLLSLSPKSYIWEKNLTILNLYLAYTVRANRGYYR